LLPYYKRTHNQPAKTNFLKLLKKELHYENDPGKFERHKTSEEMMKHRYSSLLREYIQSEHQELFPGKHSTKGLLATLSDSKGLGMLRDIIFEHSAQAFKDTPDKELHGLFDSYIDDITTDGGPCFKTQLPMSTQKKMAADVWRRLLTAKAKTDYDLLFNHGFATLMIRLATAQAYETSIEWEVYMHLQMGNLIKADKNKAEEIMQQLEDYPLEPPVTLYPSNIFVKMVSEITHEMLGCLLQLPYVDILKTQSATNS